MKGRGAMHGRDLAVMQLLVNVGVDEHPWFVKFLQDGVYPGWNLPNHRDSGHFNEHGRINVHK
jgi:hypothetical protein